MTAMAPTLTEQKQLRRRIGASTDQAIELAAG